MNYIIFGFEHYNPLELHDLWENPELNYRNYNKE